MDFPRGAKHIKYFPQGEVRRRNGCDEIESGENSPRNGFRTSLSPIRKNAKSIYLAEPSARSILIAPCHINCQSHQIYEGGSEKRNCAANKKREGIYIRELFQSSARLI
jgi:hypothetical protein